MTSSQEITRWYDEGVQDHMDWMMIVCDTFDYDFYPRYTTNDNFQERLDEIATDGSSYVKECYDLSCDREEQLKAKHTMRMPTDKTEPEEPAEMEFVAWDDAKLGDSADTLESLKNVLLSGHLVLVKEEDGTRFFYSSVTGKLLGRSDFIIDWVNIMEQVLVDLKVMTIREMPYLEDCEDVVAATLETIYLMKEESKESKRGEVALMKKEVEELQEQIKKIEGELND